MPTTVTYQKLLFIITIFAFPSLIFAQFDSIVKESLQAFENDNDELFKTNLGFNSLPADQLYKRDKERFEKYIADYFKNQKIEGAEALSTDSQILVDNIKDVEIIPKKEIRKNGKDMIKIPINLSDGTVVSIDFGASKDGENANQEVSNLLIEGLRSILEAANSSLTLRGLPPITTLYISCTTNGKHSKTSNHYSGYAIDIGRVNGKRIIYTKRSFRLKKLLNSMVGPGTNLMLYKEGNQISINNLSGDIDEVYLADRVMALQNAILDLAFFRENFGPFLKIKYRKEIAGQPNDYDTHYKVPGHQDHIHFSVR